MLFRSTTGLLGCADGSFLLEKEKRTSSKATLSIVGRDQPDQQLYLVKNQERLIWKLERKENELWKEPPDPLLEEISRLLHGDLTEWQGSATELIALLNQDIQPNISFAFPYKDIFSAFINYANLSCFTHITYFFF